MIDITRQIDEYCERVDFSFWSEPVNAVTNFAIIIAGLLALRLYHQQFPLHGSHHRPNVLILIGLVVMIGIGSFLYHTFATYWAGWLDVAPIIAFIYLYHAVFLRRILAMRYRYVLMYVLSFFGMSALFSEIFGRDALNGSIGYLPSLLSFLSVWIAMMVLKRPGTHLFGIAGLLFCCSIFFRSIDMAVCEYFPLGTHFLWHLCNSLLLYVLLKLIIQLPNFFVRKQEGKAFTIGR